MKVNVIFLWFNPVWLLTWVTKPWCMEIYATLCFKEVLSVDFKQVAKLVWSIVQKYQLMFSQSKDRKESKKAESDFALA